MSSTSTPEDPRRPLLIISSFRTSFFAAPSPTSPPSSPFVTPPRFCSDLARTSTDAHIHGSATVASFWLLIELPGPWTAREFRDGQLSRPIRECLDAWTEALPGLRIQGIRREVRRWASPGRVTVLAARAGTSPSLYRTEIASHDALLDLDVPAMLDGTAANVEEAPPIVLTCTNGRRDACCALKGRAFHTAMHSAAPNAAWQTTHLGGHRFAATSLVLPHGFQYGWLEPANADPLWAATQTNRIWSLDRYRGQVAFARPAQAAAIAVRRNHGEGFPTSSPAASLHPHTCRVDTLDRLGTDRWRVELTCAEQTYRVEVVKKTGAALPKSCGASPKPSSWYDVTDIRHWAAVGDE
jgi:hypothetical protein